MNFTDRTFESAVCFLSVFYAHLKKRECRHNPAISELRRL